MNGAARTSVVVPCYNGQHFLPGLLSSMAAQTRPVAEVIVIDDGSEPAVRIPAHFSDIRVRVIRTANHGLAAARNRGTNESVGEFVAYLDVDDLWAPQKIELQETALDARGDCIGSYTRCVSGNGYFGFGPYPPVDVSDAEFKFVLWHQLFFPPSSLMVRRRTILEAGGFREDLPISEDIECVFRLLRFGSFVQVPAPLTYYRAHSAQMTHTMDRVRQLLSSKRAKAMILADHADSLVACGIPRGRLWDAYRNDILLVYFRRDLKAARRLLWDYYRQHIGDRQLLVYALISLLPETLVRWLRGGIPERIATNGAAQDWSEIYAGIVARYRR